MKSICNVKDCENTVHGNGLCQMHYRQVSRNDEIEPNFAGRINRQKERQCIVCEDTFLGRSDSKTCGSACRMQFMRVNEISDKQELGSVYLIAPSLDQGPVKIGKTIKNPNIRLSTMQSGSPVKLHLIGTRESLNYNAMERALHKAFASSKLHGEWFDITPKEALEALLHIA